MAKKYFSVKRTKTVVEERLYLAANADEALSQAKKEDNGKLIEQKFKADKKRPTVKTFPLSEFGEEGEVFVVRIPEHHTSDMLVRAKDEKAAIEAVLGGEGISIIGSEYDQTGDQEHFEAFKDDGSD